LGDDLPRALDLAPHGINRDHAAVQVQHREQLGPCSDLVAFVVYFKLGKH
jgi:hypothetical protein